jgi:hypothetical protein
MNLPPSTLYSPLPHTHPYPHLTSHTLSLVTSSSSFPQSSFPQFSHTPYDDDNYTVTDCATECGDPNDLDLYPSLLLLSPDSSHTAEELLILKEGFLMKKGFINPAFKRRWCVLRGRQILFYKRFSDEKIRGIINVQGATVEIAEDRRRTIPFAFYLKTPYDK